MDKNLGQMSDRALQDYIQMHQLDSAEIHAAHKEYARRWWRSLLRAMAGDVGRIDDFVFAAPLGRICHPRPESV